MNMNVPWEFKPSDHPHSPSLSGIARCKYAVVGAGFTGLSTAYHLARQYGGENVVVVEADRLAAGASGRNSGMIGPGIWGPYHRMVTRFGERTAASMFAHTEQSVAAAKRLIESEDLSCHYTAGSQYKVALTEGQAKSLEREAASLRASGFAVETFDRGEMAGVVGARQYIYGLKYTDAATVNPLELARALQQRATSMGVRFYEQSPMEALHRGSINRVITRGGCVEAEQVILAINGYMPRTGTLKNRVFPIATYLLVTRPLTSSQLSLIGLARESAIIDCRNIFNFYRMTPDNRLVFGGGTPVFSDYQDGPAIRGSSECPPVEALYRELGRLFPCVERHHVDVAWRGTMGFTIDNLPVVGRIPNTGVVLAGAWCGHGLAMSLASGQTLAKHISDPSLSLDLPWERTTCPWMPPGPLLKPSISTYIAALKSLDRIRVSRRNIFARNSFRTASARPDPPAGDKLPG